MARLDRSGKPRPNGVLQQLEIDALALLRNDARTVVGMRERLNARYYLLLQGWTVAEINAAKENRNDAAHA